MPAFVDVINVYKHFFNVFYFQQVKVTQVTFPNSINIENVLNIKDNGI